MSQLSYEILLAIRNEDPDGKETEPTEDDYEAFERWVTETYGISALKLYRGSNWDEGSNEL